MTLRGDETVTGLRAELFPLARPGSRIVVVGTWSHLEGSELPAVPSVRSSVLDLAAVLRDRLGVPEQNLRRVLNPDTPLEPGKAIALSAATATDTLLVYYAGHGLVGPDGGLYLATQSTDDLAEGLQYTALPYAAVRDREPGPASAPENPAPDHRLPTGQNVSPKRENRPH